MVKGASQGIGVRSILKSLKINKASQSLVELEEDSAAARGMASTRGLRIIDSVAMIVDPRKICKFIFEALKFPGAENLAVVFTIYCEHHVLQYHISPTHQEIREDRHDLMPNLAG